MFLGTRPRPAGLCQNTSKISPEKYSCFLKEKLFCGSNLEKLNPNDSKHKEQQDCDQHDVTDCLDRDNDALDNVLQSLGPIDSSVKLFYIRKISSIIY